jgi:AcrR family transcriptional regulator
MTESQARERLLASAVDQAMNGGITDLSLREIAVAIGTSHRMLLYHFGSREGLMTAICTSVIETLMTELRGWQDPTSDARELFAHLTDPAAWPLERLFFELYAHALLGRPGTEGLLEASVEPWIATTVGLLTREGVDARTARVEARLGLAVARGLLLDLLATGDQAGVTAAYERYLQYLNSAGIGTGRQMAQAAAEE